MKQASPEGETEEEIRSSFWPETQARKKTCRVSVATTDPTHRTELSGKTMRPLNSNLLMNTEASLVPTEMTRSDSYAPAAAQGACS